MIITRKIQLNVNAIGDEKKEIYERLYKIQWSVRQCANLISSHLFQLDNYKEMIYLTEDIKLKLADEAKDEDGILVTSYQNSMYRIASQAFKGIVPTDILTNLVSTIVSTYKKEKSLIWQGKKSLRSYRDTIPIPFSKNSLKFTKQEKWYEFSLYKMPFKTYLGQDRSNNRAIIERIIDGTYTPANSSIQIKKNKIFLLLCVNIPEKDKVRDIEKVVHAQLNPITPITAQFGKKTELIGSYEEYMHVKNSIAAKRHRMQKAAKYTNGGRGRKKKLKILSKDSIAIKEQNYISTRLHTYARALVNFAIANEAGKIVLKNNPVVSEEESILLDNWGYYNLKTKIEYKAKLEGIVVEEEKEEKKKEKGKK